MVVDRFSKMAQFIPLLKLSSAKETAELVLKQWSACMVSQEMWSLITQFTFTFWHEVCSLIRATVSLSLGYHPQSNGQTERTRRKKQLCSVCDLQSSLILSSTTSIGFSNLTSSAPGFSPSQCAYEWQPPLFPAQDRQVFCPSVHRSIGIIRCRHAWTQAQGVLLCSAQCYTTSANRHSSKAPKYQVGQKVWLST